MFREALIRWGRSLVAAIFFAQVAITGANLVATAIEYSAPPTRRFPLSAGHASPMQTASPGWLLLSAFAGGACGFRLAWRRPSQEP